MHDQENSYQKIQKVLRQFPEARLVAVSKLQSNDKIKHLYHQGQRLFGENYVQELRDKIEAIELPQLEWHFIGRLQKNKIKYIIGKVALFHSIDSEELARALENEAHKKSISEVKILLQINLGDEASKAGFSPQNIAQSFINLFSLERVHIVGLMCLPPLVDNPEENRQFFNQLKTLREQLQQIKTRPSRHSMKELSMGTSHDYEVALTEGATIIRLGTVLFGERAK